MKEGHRSGECKCDKYCKYIIQYTIILSRVYNEPIQRPAPSWFVSATDRALHRYRRGQGFESRTSLNFSGSLYAGKRCVYNWDDPLSYNL